MMTRTGRGAAAAALIALILPAGAFAQAAFSNWRIEGDRLVSPSDEDSDRLFDRLDGDADGVLRSGEADVGLSADDLQDFAAEFDEDAYAAMDADRDGAVTRDEFRARLAPDAGTASSDVVQSEEFEDLRQNYVPDSATADRGVDRRPLLDRTAPPATPGQPLP